MYKSRRVVSAAISADHNPLLVSLESLGSRLLKASKGFKYETCWALEEDCEQIIGNEWERTIRDPDPSKKVQKLMNLCKGALTPWCKKIVVNRERKIKEMTIHLQQFSIYKGDKCNTNRVKLVAIPKRFKIETKSQ